MIFNINFSTFGVILIKLMFKEENIIRNSQSSIWFLVTVVNIVFEPIFIKQS